VGRCLVAGAAPFCRRRPARSASPCRPDGTGRSLELTEAAAVALRDLPPAVHRVPLGGLDWKSTEAIVRRVYGGDVSPAFVTEVDDRTGGNPFFVQEVATLRALQGERSGFPVPPGVRQVLGRRLARLS
jgi:hypothetical protein